MPKVLTSTSVVQQHVRTTYIDAISSQPQILTVCTGLLFVDFEQDDNRRSADIQYPLLGRFPDGGKGTPGIITINSESRRSLRELLPRLDCPTLLIKPTPLFGNSGMFEQTCGRSP